MKIKRIALFTNAESNIFISGAIFSLISTGIILHFIFGPINLDVPLGYGYDGISFLNLIRLIVDGDFKFLSIDESSRLGFPFGYNGFYGPFPCIGFWLIVRFFSLFTNNWFLIFNYMFIFSFYLATFGMYIVLYFLRINILVNISISLIFSFLFIHFKRITSFNFILYFYLPFVVYVALKIWDQGSFFYKTNGQKYKLNVSKKTICALVVLFFTSGINFYYSFFSVFVIGLAAIAAFCQFRNRAILASSVLVLSAIILSFLLGLSPYIVERYNIPYADSVLRNSSDAVKYGLKISDLILPIHGHRLDFLNEVRLLTKDHPLTNENTFIGLGTVGTFGFLSLIAVLLLGRDKQSFLGKLSILNIGILLLATIGGFSTLFAILISPNIRGYSRISIFIAIISLFSVAHILTKLFKKVNLTIQILTLILITFFAILDQTVDTWQLSADDNLKGKFISDRDFVAEIERCMDKGQAIYQYPNMRYPESAPRNKLIYYELLTDTLHSTKIRWTSGSVKGTLSDAYHNHLASLPLKDQMDYISNSLYAGIVIYNLGFKDHGEEISKFITDNYNITKVIKSNDGNKVFYKFGPSDKSACLNFAKLNNFVGYEGEITNPPWAKGNALISVYCDCAECPSVNFGLTTGIDRNVTLVVNNKTQMCYDLERGQRKNVFVSGLVKGLNQIELLTDKPPVRLYTGDPFKRTFCITDLALINK